MSDALSFVEIDGQHVELLPARTVLSLFTTGGQPVGDTGTGGAAGTAGAAGTGGAGGASEGKAVLAKNWFYTEGDVYNELTGSTGGTGGASTGGASTGGAGLTK